MEKKQISQRLGGLPKGSRALIIRVGRPGLQSGDIGIQESRLMEMGLLEGSWVEIVHEAPFGGDPIAVRVRGTLIALRRSEANLIEVATERVDSALIESPVLPMAEGSVHE